MRFRAEQRLRRQQDFRAARERGRRIDCGGFTLWYRRRSAGEGVVPELSEAEAKAVESLPRVGVVASTAAVGCAVRRNRAKRKLREGFRLHQQQIPPGYDLLMVARKSVVTDAFERLENRFVEACEKISKEGDR